MHTIDVNAVFGRVPGIMGLADMRLRNGRWTGPYYINRERHRHRRDKLSVWIYRGAVMVGEQGGDAMTIQKWLREYGGCSTWNDVYSVLDGQRPMEMPCIGYRDGGTGKYVSPSVQALYEAKDLFRCELFGWFCSLFGAGPSAEAWRRYGATTDDEGNAVYWYRDRSGRICHDKVMRYLVNGHRDKSKGVWRRFKSADGFTARCLFGVNLLEGWNGDVFLVESEKTALMCSCVWDDCLFLASGGKNTANLAGDGWVLLPDVDGFDEWSRQGTCSMWFDRWKGCGAHSDIGDLIELYAKSGKLDVLRRNDVKKELLFNIKGEKEK